MAKGFSLNRGGKFPIYLCRYLFFVTFVAVNKRYDWLLMMLLAPAVSNADESDRCLLNQLEYQVDLEANTGDGRTNPLWLNANKYGLSSLNCNSGYLRASLTRPLSRDDDRRWGIGYGVDVAGATHYTSHVIVQQAYVEARWLKGVLTIGSKEQPMEMKDAELSSGSQTLGINARPVPQMRVALRDFWQVPGTGGWLGLKGHISYGKTTDDRWQRDFTSQTSKYTQGTWIHTKACYLNIGNEQRFKPLSLELGIEMAAQYGGDSYNLVNVEGGKIAHLVNEGGLKGAWHAFTLSGYDTSENEYKNVSGNQLGSWMARLNYQNDSWSLGCYIDHFFEDHSQLYFLGTNGYGEDGDWQKRKSSSLLAYSLKDMMLGGELKLKRGSWLRGVVLEYLYTKYQSGPIYHDHTQNIYSQISGNDDYYNHSIFTGWQHWGQVMGNPLYISPIYNEDGKIEVKNNRFVAWHLGFNGNPTAQLHYRLLATYEKGYGRYNEPFDDPKENLSLLAEVNYHFTSGSRMKGWAVTAALGLDRGQLLGNNTAGQLTITKTGLLNLKTHKNKQNNQ